MYKISEDSIIDFLTIVIGIDIENIFSIETVALAPQNRNIVIIKFKARYGSKRSTYFVEAKIDNSGVLGIDSQLNTIPILAKDLIRKYRDTKFFEVIWPNNY